MKKEIKRQIEKELDKSETALLQKDAAPAVKRSRNSNHSISDSNYHSKMLAFSKTNQVRLTQIKQNSTATYENLLKKIEQLFRDTLTLEKSPDSEKLIVINSELKTLKLSFNLQ